MVFTNKWSLVQVLLFTFCIRLVKIESSIQLDTKIMMANNSVIYQTVPDYKQSNDDLSLSFRVHISPLVKLINTVYDKL